MSTLTDEILAHVRSLSPHVRDKPTPELLRRACDELMRLEHENARLKRMEFTEDELAAVQINTICIDWNAVLLNDDKPKITVKET